MSADLRTLMPGPLIGLKVYRTPESVDDVEADPRAVWLLRLRELAVQRVHRHEQLMAMVDSINAAIGELPELVSANLAAVASLAAEIGLAVAREVVGDALDRGIVDPTPVVRRCLEDATAGTTGGKIEVRLHPEDLSLCVDHLQRESDAHLVDGTQFVPDPSVPRGGARVDTPAGRLVYEHREVLQRVSNAMRIAVAEYTAEVAP